ncbi:RNA polymerase sigma factor [Desulfovibrio inopinatus]|uniref:RNA polymerase sigma factor n=1 Tax=Desulfovibrio inopinatus TaxID=102109 RepID=UPI000686A807|nr:RNA polymerase sigma factor [Desulfovibrio inopinatus]
MNFSKHKIEEQTEAELDRQAVAAVLAGNVHRFEELVRRHSGLVDSIVSRKVPTDKVPDVAQDAFIRAFNALGGFQESGCFPAWLRTIAVRTCLDFWRKEYARHETPFATLDTGRGDWLDCLMHEESLNNHDRQEAIDDSRELLQYGLSRLSAEDRMVVTLVHLEEYSVSEAAKMLDMSSVAVKVRAHRARKKLRTIMQDALVEDVQ